MEHTEDNYPFDPAQYRMCESPGFLLIRARGVLTNGLEQELSGLDITHAQATCLLMLTQNRARTVTDLGREMNTDMGSITRVVSRMEKRGLVERQRSEADRRIVELIVTEQGQAVVQMLPQMICRVLNRHFGDFTPQELDLFRGMLRRIIGCGAAGAIGAAPASAAVTEEPSDDGGEVCGNRGNTNAGENTG